MLEARSAERNISLKAASPTQADYDGLTEGTARRSGFRLMIIDPRALSRDCLVAALEATSRYQQIIAVSSVPAAIDELKRIEAPDVVVLNLSSDPFRDDSVIPLTDAIRAVAATSGIVILASDINKARAAMALGLGVRGFLDCDTPFDVATEAIRFVAGGWMIYPAFDFSNDMRALGDISDEAVRSFQFTARQRQVLDGLEQGLTNGKIAAAMNVSERTIKAHVKEIMRRVGATNRTQIVARMAGMRQLALERAIE